MTDVPVQVVVAAFNDPNGASQAYQRLKAAKKQHFIALQDVAVLTMDAEGKLHIKETKDMSAGRGFFVGTLVGGAIGLLTGGIGWIALGGGALGAMAAKLRDGGFPDERLKELGSALKPNTSAIVAVIEHTWVADLEKELAQAGAQMVTESLKADIAQQLAAGGSVMYSMADTGDAVVAGRTVVPSTAAASVTAPPPKPAQKEKKEKDDSRRVRKA